MNAAATTTPKLYRELASLWPLVSPVADYAGEATVLRKLLRKELGRMQGMPRVLELGAGGGHTLHHLRTTFDMTAVDLSPAMLAQCRRLNPGVTTIVGDMRSVRLGANLRGDAVLIHDAVDYLLSPRDIRRTLATARVHLRPGGVLIIAPTYVRETFHDDEFEADQHTDGRTTVSYLSHVHAANRSSRQFELTLVFVISRPGKKTRVVTDHHTCGLFSIDQWLTLMTDAGFTSRAVNDTSTAAPHVLLVGRRDSTQ